VQYVSGLTSGDYEALLAEKLGLYTDSIKRILSTVIFLTLIATAMMVSFHVLGSALLHYLPGPGGVRQSTHHRRSTHPPATNDRQRLVVHKCHHTVNVPNFDLTYHRLPGSLSSTDVTAGYGVGAPLVRTGYFCGVTADGPQFVDSGTASAGNRSDYSTVVRSLPVTRSPPLAILLDMRYSETKV